MRILPITPPVPGQQPSEALKALVVHSSAVRQQVTGNPDLAFSIEQLLGDLYADPEHHRVFACVADEDQILHGVTPLGDVLPGSVSDAAQDPSVGVRILGWVELHIPSSKPAASLAHHGVSGSRSGAGRTAGQSGVRVQAPSDAAAFMDLTVSADIYPMPGDPVSTHVREVIEELVSAAGNAWAGAIEACTFTGAAEAPTRSVIAKTLYSLGFSLSSIDTIACIAMPRYKLAVAAPAGFSVLPVVSATEDRIRVVVSGPAGEAACILERPEGRLTSSTATARVLSHEASPSVIACALRVAINQARLNWHGVQRIYSDDHCVGLAMRAAGWQIGIVPVAGRALWSRPARVAPITLNRAKSQASQPRSEHPHSMSAGVAGGVSSMPAAAHQDRAAG